MDVKHRMGSAGGRVCTDAKSTFNINNPGIVVANVGSQDCFAGGKSSWLNG